MSKKTELQEQRTDPNRLDGKHNHINWTEYLLTSQFDEVTFSNHLLCLEDVRGHNPLLLSSCILALFSQDMD